jgi:protein TonB
VEYVNTPLARFFAASLAIHLAFLLLWPRPAVRSLPEEAMSVSFIPAPQEKPKEKMAAPVKQAPRAAPTRPSRSPAIIAKKNSPEVKRSAPPQVAVAPTPQNAARETTPEPPAKTQEPVEADMPTTERKLPTLKELLPPITWSAPRGSNTERDGPVRLDTKNPQYITYFNSIKRDIELVWQYPEPALRYGLQGKLLLEFSVLADGHLESARVIRSSGSSLLDHEALRAIRAAAPFSPIPPWIDQRKIDIIASFEYLDNRLDYRVMP